MSRFNSSTCVARTNESDTDTAFSRHGHRNVQPAAMPGRNKSREFRDRWTGVQQSIWPQKKVLASLLENSSARMSSRAAAMTGGEERATRSIFSMGGWSEFPGGSRCLPGLSPLKVH